MTGENPSGAPSLAGVWSYRAFFNDPDLDKPFGDLRFATAALTLETGPGGALSGRLSGEGWGTWIEWSLTLTGQGDASGFTLRGENVIEGETWIYDYRGQWLPNWPHADQPRDVLTGSVIRTAARAKRASKAGVHATFIAVKRG